MHGVITTSKRVVSPGPIVVFEWLHLGWDGMGCGRGETGGRGEGPKVHSLRHYGNQTEQKAP